MATALHLTQRLDAHQRICGKLCKALAEIGPIKRGSIYKTYTGCGSPGCQCHRDPKARHGPYWLWTCKVGRKSLCRQLDGTVLKLYRQYTSNYKKLKQILKKIETISDQILKCQMELAELEKHGRGRRTKGK